ncbi:MAG: hypothetical protein LBV09_05165 [Deferribacteraceae bacterium]|jgi:hypothetical protein|nr:hypothetical protein [Deferribacteraceae bacterium]
MQNHWKTLRDSTTQPTPQGEHAKYAIVGELINEKLGRQKLLTAGNTVVIDGIPELDKPTLPENIILLEQLKQYCNEAFKGGKFIENEANGKIQLQHIMDFIAKNGDRRLKYEEIVAGAERLEQELAIKKRYKILYREDMKKLPADTPDKFQAMLDIYAEKNDYLYKNKIASIKGVLAGNETLRQMMKGMS